VTHPVASSTHEIDLGRIAARVRLASGGLLVPLLPLYMYAVVVAPVDGVQGVIQKILYVHPPLAYLAYLGFFITAVCGTLYLWREQERWDRLALAAAEVGVVFCTLMLLTGPIWAKGTWGKWWSWDPRLTLTLVLWFVYLAYLLLRSFSDGGTRTARFAAVYGLVGVALIPLNYFVIEMFDNRGMHPENLKSDSFGEGILWPFVVSNVTLCVLFLYLLLLRWEVEALRARAALMSPQPSRVSNNG
jgi:heme exporter protein C